MYPKFIPPRRIFEYNEGGEDINQIFELEWPEYNGQKNQENSLESPEIPGCRPPLPHPPSPLTTFNAAIELSQPGQSISVFKINFGI